MQVGAVFGLVFALIVMGFVLLFGSEQIANLLCMGGISQTSKVVKELEIVVDDIQASGQGSSDTIDMRIAANSKVCIIDPENPWPNLSYGWMPAPGLLIEEEIQSSGYNVWIEHNCGTSDSGYIISHMITDHNFCARAGDVLLVTNVGADVRVEKLLI